MTWRKIMVSRRELLLKSGALFAGLAPDGNFTNRLPRAKCFQDAAPTDRVGFNGPFHLEVRRARRIEIHYKLELTRAAADAAAWMVYVSQPPCSPGQPDATLTVSLPGTRLRAEKRTEEMPLQRRFQTLWVDVSEEAQRSQLTVEAVLTATMQTRKLKPGTPDVPVSPLPALYAREYTKSTRFYDFDTPGVRTWIRENALFGAVLRANKIPYRNMGGRWSYSNAVYKDTENNHSRSELWCDGIGWVPVDATAPGPKGATREEIESKFGSDTGDFFAIHEDLDYVIPVLNHPSLTLGWFHYYVVVYGADGNPLANGADVKQTWSIREVSRG